MQVPYANAVGYTADKTDNKNEAQVLGKDDFLKLLITQLRHQDPMNPIEDKDFIAQLAQFSSLEQMQQLTTTMNTMMDSQQKLTALAQATSMIGKVVEVFSHDEEHLYGKVSGVQFKSGWPEIIVDGKLYDFTEVVSIFEESVDDGQ
ncbi:MAG: flagellar hook assembly protein FlgD [Firmicutes bacterium]|nr:flagellar hook assembly protein FlgD [Bacillota bacterium]